MSGLDATATRGAESGSCLRQPHLPVVQHAIFYHHLHPSTPPPAGSLDQASRSPPGMPSPSSRTETPPPASYSTMSVGDVEAIGAHCQMAFCHQLDFLPFRCESCRGKFCLDHRTESAHSCANAGAWARARQQATTSTTTPSPKPSILTHESQCSAPACKTLINTPLVPGIECAECNRSYCLKHRMKEEHDCKNLPRVGARAKDSSLGDALSRLRAWGASRKAAAPGTASPATKSIPSATSRLASSISATASRATGRSPTPASSIVALNTLKRTAQGDAKVPVAQRVYVYIEAVSEGTTVQANPKGTAFYSGEWSVGKVLDAAAKSLGINNVNNRGGGEEERLRVFHVEGGRVLEFGEKLGQGVKSGNTLVLLRGIGPVS